MKKTWKVHRKGFTYSEKLLQWIWENLLFENSSLCTANGKSLKVLDQGVLNLTDGPDFKDAVIEIDGIVWHGSVELHLNASGWKLHNHHIDPNYNQVILHIVVEDSPEDVSSKNGASPATLNLLPYLPKELIQFITNFRGSKHLPCAEGLHYISPDVFRTQIEKAHREYFEKKADDFLRFYNPNLLSSVAWKHALVISIFDAFGITYNREPMREVGEWFLNQEKPHKEGILDEVYQFAGFLGSEGALNWNYKGVRPHNHPKKRIEQAVKLSRKILETPMESFLEESPEFFLTGISKEAHLDQLNRTAIIYGTVFLPAMYILGTLFGSSRISEKAHTLWMNLHTPVPKKLLQKFENIDGIKSSHYYKKLGSVHQLKAYCYANRCDECLVLKRAILS